ncbi:translation initiation factor IF-2 [Candidatus Roizmanbacteria bacterium]|nr:translation initiation factor IF-2 [Candidatus Roizmanbacteria bacterium]
MLQPRPPIVAILGHVDHGKTTLLDYIRKSHITTKEYGGITQHIGAYEISTGIKDYKTDKITFIDTPGHEAFSMLRARGANVADIAVLVIDAKDSVMPQTIESISHIKAAKIPFVIALNKIDLPDSNPEKVKNDLMKHEVIVEGKGGTVAVIQLSAKTGKGVNELLEAILLLAAESNLTFDEKNPPRAHIIETKKDKRGIVLSIIIKDGTIKVGDTLYIGPQKAKVRSMSDDLGKTLKVITPSKPVEIFGFEHMPEVGTVISGQTTESVQKEKKTPPLITKEFSIDTLLQPQEKKRRLALIIKTDSQGSLEAVSNSLEKNENIEIVLKGVGEIHKSDIFLAKTSKAIVIGFAVAIAPEVKDLAKQEKIIIKTYNIIYELLEELGEVADLLKEKEEKERNLKGEAKVLATFIIGQEKVFGVRVNKGKINLSDPIEIHRQNKLLGKTKLVSLKIRAKSMNEVKKDQEAGMIFNPQLDIRVGDMVKSIL